jgi:hypothetical protein
MWTPVKGFCRPVNETRAAASSLRLCIEFVPAGDGFVPGMQQYLYLVKKGLSALAVDGESKPRDSGDTRFGRRGPGSQIWILLGFLTSLQT